MVGLLMFLAWSGGEQASSPPRQTVQAGPPAAADVHPAHATTTTTAAPPPTTSTSSTTTTTSSPPPSTSSPPPPSSPGCAGWAEEIAAVFPSDQVAKACAVMLCETGGTGDPTIHNPGTSASGLFQFLDGTWASTTGLSPPAADHPATVQIAAAHTLWSSSGWAPWSCA